MKADQVDRRDCRYELRRCYKLISLIHVNRRREFFFVAAARVVGGRRHECPLLYELAEQFVAAVGPGVMKMLIEDRGLIDGPRMGRLKRFHHVDTLVPLRTNMDAHAGAIGLTRLPTTRPPAVPIALGGITEWSVVSGGLPPLSAEDGYGFRHAEG